MANDNTTRDDAEFWASPGSVTGTRPDLGDNRKVAL
jgi:hypothetical protein